MKRRIAAGLALAGALSAAAQAGELTLTGAREQGSILFGQATGLESLHYEGRRVRLTPKGRFVLGLGRDAPKTVELELSWADGTKSTRKLDIARRDYAIERIDGLPDKQVTPDKQVLKRIRREAAKVYKARRRDDARTDFEGRFVWPVTGRITGVYGSQRVLNGEPKRPHYGIDIAAAAGTPVKAPADGVVTLTDTDMYYSGGTLILDHGHGLSSCFLHMSRIAVEEGQRVQRGEVLGEVGSSGRSTGAHLDWRMNWFHTRLDPRYLVEPEHAIQAGAGDVIGAGASAVKGQPSAVTAQQ